MSRRLLGMADITFSPSDIEATRRFLAAQQVKETMLFYLLKETPLLEPEDRRFFTCGIHEVSAVVALDRQKDYGFSLNLIGAPGEPTDIRGLENLILAEGVSPGYEASAHIALPKKASDRLVVTAVYGPKAKVYVHNELAFQFHLESFCDYSARVLTSAIESNFEWSVPARNYILQCGQLQRAEDPAKKK